MISKIFNAFCRLLKHFNSLYYYRGRGYKYLKKLLKKSNNHIPNLGGYDYRTTLVSIFIGSKVEEYLINNSVIL